eukprot:scaffold133638_cov44-Prasinocladus_malaysianus.AAC.1
MCYLANSFVARQNGAAKTHGNCAIYLQCAMRRTSHGINENLRGPMRQLWRDFQASECVSLASTPNQATKQADGCNTCYG